MKWRVPIFTAVLLIAAAACAQTDNTIYIRNFAGANVGAKVAAAQLTCGPNTQVPCILVIDPSLAAWPAGTLPTLCSHCYLWDFRSGPPEGGGGNSVTVVPFATPAAIHGALQAYDALSCNTNNIDIRCFGAVIDGATHIDAAFQLALNKLFTVYGGSGTIVLPCIRQNSTGPGCFLQNSSLLTSPAAGTAKIELQGGLQLGSTLVVPYWQQWTGMAGGPAQFQTGAVPATVFGPNVNGTIGTAITAAATATTVTPTFSDGGIANLPVGSAITIAEVGSSSATAVRIACTSGLANCPYGSGQTTLTLASSALRIPPGEILTVTGCSDTSFNTTNNAVSHSDYTAKQVVYFQTDATPSTASGCTVSGFNEDKYESARILCSNGVSGTFNGVTYSSCSAGQVTILTSHTHLSTDPWGEVVAGPAFNTYNPQTFKDINFGYGTGMAFWAEGSTNLEMDNVGISASNYITSGAMECSACYRNKFHNLFSSATEFSQAVPVCPGGGCTQPSYPYALRLDSDVTGFYYSSTVAGCQECDFDEGPELIGGGVKIDGSGVPGRAVTGLPHFQSPMTEEVWGAVFTIDNRAGIESQDALSVKDPFNQDNLSGWSQYLVNYTDGNLPPTGCVAIERGSYLGGDLYGPYFNSPCAIDDSTLDPMFSVPLNEAGPSGTYNQGNMNEVENQNEGSDFGPQILPFGSLPVTGFSQSALATACSVTYACTATSVPGPDGPSGQMPAVQIVSSGNGFSGTIATDTRQTYAGDHYIYWSWVRPIPGQPFTIGAGNAGGDNSFSISDGYSTFAATNCGTLSCDTGAAWPQAFGTGVSNNGWSPQVAIATILAGNGGSHAVTLQIGLASASGSGNQWAEPGWAFIPGPNNPACTAAGTCNLSADQIEEARRDQYHGCVPPNATAGQLATCENGAGGSGNMSDGSGSSTAGLFAETTIIPHSFSLNAPATVLSQIGGASVLGNTIDEAGGWESWPASGVYRFMGSSAANATLPLTIPNPPLLASINNGGSANLTITSGGPTLVCLPVSCVVPPGASAFVNTDGTDWYAMVSSVSTNATATYWQGWYGGTGGISPSGGEAGAINGWAFSPEISVTFNSIDAIAWTVDSTGLYSFAIADSSGALVCHPTTGVHMPAFGSLMVSTCSEGTVTLNAGSTYILLSTGNSATAGVEGFTNSSIPMIGPFFSYGGVSGCSSSSGVISGTCAISLSETVYGNAPTFSLH